MKGSLLSTVSLVVLGLACSENAAVQPTPPNFPLCASNGVPFTGPLCAIAVPGAAVVSGAKGWADTSTGDYYFDDQSNQAVDVISLQTYKYVGRITGFVGAATGASGGTITYGGGTTTSNGQGPNSIVPTVAGKIWVTDGNTTVKVVTVGSLSIDTSISTAVAACDGGTATTHFCGRNNEMTWDPQDKIVLVETPNPLSLTYCQANPATCATAAAISPENTGTLPSYATFISAVAPYPILGRISFTDVEGTTEAPVWDPELKRFLLPVPTCSGTTGATACASGSATQYIAVIDPNNLATYAGVYSAATAGAYLIPSCASLGATGQTGMINDLSFDEVDQTIIMPACGHEVVVNAMTGAVLNNSVVQQVGSSDETTFNPADSNFYVVGTIPVGQTNAGRVALGQISGKTGLWIQNTINVGGKDPTAYKTSDRVLTFVTPSVAQVAAPSTDTTACAGYGYAGIGCIVVFGK